MAAPISTVVKTPLISLSNPFGKTANSTPATSFSNTPNFQGSVSQGNTVNTAPVQASGSAGTYKGVSINPGADADIAAQMRSIDASQSPTKGLVSVTPTLPKSNPIFTTPSGAQVDQNGNVLSTPAAPFAPGNPQIYPNIVSTLAEKSTTPTAAQQEGLATAQTGSAEYNRIINEIKATRDQEAQALADNSLNPIPIGDITGRQGILKQLYETKLANLASQAQGATNLYSPALSAAVTTQGQQLGALGNLAGLAPEALRYEAFGGPSFAGVIDQYAQLAATNQLGAIPSAITGNPVLWQQVLSRAQQLNPSFNYNTALGSASGQQTLAQTTGGSAAAGAFGNLTQQVSSLKSAASGADANFALMLNIATQGGVNQNNVPILNTLQRNVSRGLASDAAVVNFTSLLNTVRSQYAAIIGGGTVTVESLQEAQAIIPNDISIAALQSLQQNLAADAQNRITGIQDQLNSIGGSNNTTPNNGNGQSIQVPGADGKTYTFILDANGQYVVQ